MTEPSEMHEAMCPALTGDRCTCERNDPAVDKAWARFCGGIGDGPDAPYPGMISAFERYYSQSFTDKDWRNEASVWAAAWKQALLTAAAPTTQPAPQQEALEPVAWQSRTRPTWGGNDRPWSPWEPCTKGQAEDCWKTPLLHDWAYEARALYTAPQPSPAAQGDALDAARWRALLACGRIRIIGTAGVTGTGAHDPKALDPNKQPCGNYVHFGAEFWSTFPDQDYYNTKENPAYARATLTEFADAARAAQEGSKA